MIKRVLDFAGALLLLVLLLPVLLLTAVSVWLLLSHSIIFHQARAGYGGRVFQVYKFRSMTDARGTDGELLPDAERLTSFGRFLRAASLDELPQLWNILRGEMSFIGPRPLLVQYLPLYSAEQSRRHDVLPGITGWAQVNGRNAISWEEKFILDVWYVDHQSLWLDAKIVLLTIWKLIRPRDISATGDATMPPFQGSEPK